MATETTPSSRRDVAIGVFTDDGPWEVDPDALAWRHGLAGGTRATWTPRSPS